MDKVQKALTEKLRNRVTNHRKDATVLDRSPLIIPIVDRGRFSIRLMADGQLNLIIAITDILTERVFWEMQTTDEERAVARYVEIISNPTAWLETQVF